jgi:probable F420-dependent oxidoreductase
LKHFSVWRSAGGAPLPEGLAIAVEESGFRRLWLGGAAAELTNAEQALAETENLWLASGIVNIWGEDAHTTAASYHRLEERYPGRFVLGIGTGHPERFEQYTKPYESIQHYLDALDEDGVPEERRVLAALGPRVMKLAAARSAGAHPYLTTPEHTAEARRTLGPGKLLVPEQTVVLTADPDQARAIARPWLARYLGYVNYCNNWRRLGFTDEDLAGGGSSRLVDALIAHGTADEIAARAGAHIDAGADEVCVQVLSESSDIRPEVHALGDALNRWEAARAR